MRNKEMGGNGEFWEGMERVVRSFYLILTSLLKMTSCHLFLLVFLP